LVIVSLAREASITWVIFHASVVAFHYKVMNDLEFMGGVIEFIGVCVVLVRLVENKQIANWSLAVARSG
jgi:hypothetical protein